MEGKNRADKMTADSLRQGDLVGNLGGFYSVAFDRHLAVAELPAG